MFRWRRPRFYRLLQASVALTVVAGAITTLLIHHEFRVSLPSYFPKSFPVEEADDPVLAEKQVLDSEARIVAGLGEGGEPVTLAGLEQVRAALSEGEHAVNVYLSDMIAYNRTLEDYRHPLCDNVLYDATLPSASVIITFHNEPYSVLLRTIWSVVNSARRDRVWYRRANHRDFDVGHDVSLGYVGQEPDSVLVYLKELILVDDASSLPELRGKLSHYVRTRLPANLVRVVRLTERAGAGRARYEGARAAEGSVLVFLDAHCECQPDWLRPLLQRIKQQPQAVVTPVVDVLDKSTLHYTADREYFQVGGFTFEGQPTWVDVSQRERHRRGPSDIAPTWSPTMAGGMFAISWEYYWQLGGHDADMRGHGGDSLEMSFKTWQCGGTLEVLPCSRVGHVFPDHNPRQLPGGEDYFGINTARVAEVWMDEYKELFYLHRPDLRNSTKVGDLSSRKQLREKLQCKSFQWYLQHVYREKFVPVRDAFGYGRFRNPASAQCLDNRQSSEEFAPLGVFQCHHAIQTSQFLTLTLGGQLRDELRCAELRYIASAQEKTGEVVMAPCNSSSESQKWRYSPSKHLVHVQSGMCLSVTSEVSEAALRARSCQARRVNVPFDAAAIDSAELAETTLPPSYAPQAAPDQLWHIEYSEINGFKMAESASRDEAFMPLWSELARSSDNEGAKPHVRQNTTEELCKHVLYDASLPSASVIITFHNEPYSVLLRAIWSVLTTLRRDRPWYQQANYRDEMGRNMTLGYPGQDPASPLVYLKELILVDDNSTLPELQGKFSHYVRTRLPADVVKMMRVQSGSAARARQAGAHAATGSVLVFLDAHCEGQADWLRPLLQRVQDKRDAVVMPVVDEIQADFKPLASGDDFQVGGFSFEGLLKWIEVPEREKKRRGSDIAPTWSPTMAGGLFAINREYFWQLGGYDEQMTGWGGENLEMSLRIWQCGGTLETIPCSRASQSATTFNSYNAINIARAAKVWMDEYRVMFYLHRPDLRNSKSVGDLSSRERLRKKLKCKSFEWYLRNVYTEKFVFVQNTVGYGRFRNTDTGNCLASLQGPAPPTPLGLYHCSEKAMHAGDQHFALTWSGQLRDEMHCVVLRNVSWGAVSLLEQLEKQPFEGEEPRLLLDQCGNVTGQQWHWTHKKQLIHSSGLCLSAVNRKAEARECEPGNREQRWEIDYARRNNYGIAEDEVPDAMEQALIRLRLRGDMMLDSQNVSNSLNTTKTANTSDTSIVSNTSDTSNVSNTSDTSNVSNTSDTSNMSNTSDALRLNTTNKADTTVNNTQHIAETPPTTDRAAYEDIFVNISSTPRKRSRRRGNSDAVN